MYTGSTHDKPHQVHILALGSSLPLFFTCFQQNYYDTWYKKQILDTSFFFFKSDPKIFLPLSPFLTPSTKHNIQYSTVVYLSLDFLESVTRFSATGAVLE